MFFSFCFLNDTSTTEIYPYCHTLSLHDALPICLHLLARVLHEPEYGRYRHLRQHWGGDQRKFFVFFQGQALFVVLFSVPFVAAASNPTAHFSIWSASAIAIWLLALLCEALADRQLARFRGSPQNRGKTCRAGLWSWSRHPNYFFEWLHWFAYVVLAIGSPWPWLARSEEHTSELQSLMRISYAVFCLKKKTSRQN